MKLGLGLGLGSSIRQGLDFNAASFISRAGITNPAQKTAINNLVIALKGYGIWSKMVALYPYVGGSASSHAQNLVNSSFTISWNGTVTHNANGVTGNGSTGYGDTTCKASDVGVNGGLSTYLRALPTGDNNCSIGMQNASDRGYEIIMNVSFGQKYGIWGATASIASQSTVPATGLYSVNRTSSTALTLYRNGSSIASDSTSSSLSATALNIYTLALNNNGSTSSFSEENCALDAIHQGLTASEESNFYTAVQSYQTALSRQV